MATSKTLTPTNVTIYIPGFTDQPDQRVNSNCIDKEADAINALNTNIPNMLIQSIPNNTDLNTLRNGIFKCTANADAATMSNCPTNVAFMLFSSHTSQTGCVQIMATANTLYVRRATSGSWGHWYKFDGTDTGA